MARIVVAMYIYATDEIPVMQHEVIYDEDKSRINKFQTGKCIQPLVVFGYKTFTWIFFKN